MITVHHLDRSRSQRILWLLEELGLEYRVEHYRRDPQTLLAPASLRDVHPLGKSPVVVDDGRVLVESGAIVEALIERYAAGGELAMPTDPDARQRWRYWLHYAEGSLTPPLLLKLVFDRIRAARMPFFAKPIARKIADSAMAAFIGPQLTLHLDYLEREVGRTGWFAGERFSAADIQMSYPLEAAVQRAGLDRSRPRLLDWLERIQARPAYRAALQRGGDRDQA